MDLNPDFKDMLKCLNAHDVEYILVGSFALALHGRPRVTGDIDFWIRPTPDNAKRTMQALRDFGMALPGLSEKDFAQPDQIIQLGYPPVRIDLITSITGVSWDEAWPERIRIEIEGLPITYLGLRQFIANKKATGRAKDLGDIQELDQLD